MEKRLDNLLKDLNNVQKEAVNHFDTPLLLIAGAGSGKTRVITHKIAYLVAAQMCKPYEILAVTFTNKAADEMRMRVTELTGIEGRHFQVSTFHSFGLKILRESGSEFGYSRDWRIIDDGEQKKILNNIFTQLNVENKKDYLKEIKRKISRAKVEGIYPSDFDTEYLERMFFEEIDFKVYLSYFQYQKDNKLWDYDDLISLPVKMLKKSQDLRHYYEGRYKYILVDEFQDTNPNQYELVSLLGLKHKNITIVGDDDQAIYSWRGASPGFLSDFERDFFPVKVIKLEQNYRSNSYILDFANDLIANNMNRREKNMWTDNKSGKPVCILKTFNKEEEATSASQIISVFKRDNPELLPMAVLYRNNSQSLAFESEFGGRGIKFKVLKGQRFFDRKEVKDALALLRLAINKDDNLAFLRVIDFLPLGIGSKTLSRIEEKAEELECSLFNALKVGFNKQFLSKKIFPIIDDIAKESNDYSHICTVLSAESGYRKFLSERKEEDRLLNIDELISFLKNWQTQNSDYGYNELMDLISLDAGEKKEGKEDEAYLLTMHNAKGMEFNSVFVAGINSTFMPFFIKKSIEEIEEERRLFYVASTRAIKQLFISIGAVRPSSFLEQVKSSLYCMSENYFDYIERLQSGINLKDSVGMVQKRKVDVLSKEKKYLQKDTFYRKSSVEQSKPKENLKKAEHPFFGKGEILKDYNDGKYLINFFEKGEKIIDSNIIKLKIFHI